MARKSSEAHPALLAALDVRENVTLVLHDWGSGLGFDWANRHRGHVKAIVRGPAREFCRAWPNQREVSVPGIHFLQEDSADAIGEAIASFLANF